MASVAILYSLLPLIPRYYHQNPDKASTKPVESCLIHFTSLLMGSTRTAEKSFSLHCEVCCFMVNENNHSILLQHAVFYSGLVYSTETGCTFRYGKWEVMLLSSRRLMMRHIHSKRAEATRKGQKARITCCHRQRIIHWQNLWVKRETQSQTKAIRTNKRRLGSHCSNTHTPKLKSKLLLTGQQLHSLVWDMDLTGKW